jgi:hypothetical protein
MYGNEQSDGTYDKFATMAFMHQAWAFGGAVVYEGSGDPNDKSATVRIASASDVRTFKEYGDRASIMIANTHLGAARQIVIYNFD